VTVEGVDEGLHHLNHVQCSRTLPTFLGDLPLRLRMIIGLFLKDPPPASFHDEQVVLMVLSIPRKTTRNDGDTHPGRKGILMVILHTLKKILSITLR
jgi:hypothetical protein